MSEAEQHNDSERVETILAHLQEEISRHRLALGQMGALEPPDLLAEARQHKWVNSHLPIGWPVMPKGILAKGVAVLQKVVRRLLCWYINPIVDQQNHYNDAVFDRLAADQANVSQVAGSLHALEDRTAREALLRDQAHQAREGMTRDITALATQVAALQQAVEAQQAIIHDERNRRIHDQEVVRFRLQRIDNTMRTVASDASPETPAIPINSNLPPIDYYLLGLIHRSEEQLEARLSDYDDLFLNGLAGPALDLGCGRGDVVQHLGGMGIDASGVDMDDEAVRIGQAQGRKIVTGDMFAYLRQVPDSTLGAVLLIQVAEHLTFDALRGLMADALRALAPGGFIVIETINPTCVTALTNAYLLDPSHVAPLHPMMTQFLLEQAGYADVAIRYLHEVEESQQLQPHAEMDKPMSQNLDKLNSILYGAQDYAAIAIKQEAI